jgi:hypothetical protein
MTEKKKKEEDISSETSKKKKPTKSGRLSDMIESMQKRGSPLNAHRVATRYFDSFRKERNIPGVGKGEESSGAVPPAPDENQESKLTTAVDNTVISREKRKHSASDAGLKHTGPKGLEESFTPSESRVYAVMHKKSVDKKSPTLRFGLKELKELTGLSDKTIRVAIHSLEKKLSLRVVEPSLGIYGRKFYVPGPDEVVSERLKAGLEIDPTTKRITAINTAFVTDQTTNVTTAVNTAVNTGVDTAIEKDLYFLGEKTVDVTALYEFYSGNEIRDEDRVYFETIKHLDARVIEAALILTSLKGREGLAGMSGIDEILAVLKDEVSEEYIRYLREVWKAARG